jgi:hypothetical protein
VGDKEASHVSDGPEGCVDVGRHGSLDFEYGRAEDGGLQSGPAEVLVTPPTILTGNLG